MLYKEIKALLWKDFQLELRQKYAINSIILYLISTVFLTYLSFQGEINARSWNAIFWIILLFAAVNAVSKSFVQENNSRYLYYFTLTSPQSIILAKIIYNSLIMLVVSFLNYFIFKLFLGNFIEGNTIFIITLFLGSLAFSSTLTMVSAIASRTQNNFALMSILSFPLILPFLLSLMKLSSIAFTRNQFDIEIIQLLGFVFCLNLIVIILSYILFPFLWKE